LQAKVKKLFRGRKNSPSVAFERKISEFSGEECPAPRRIQRLPKTNPISTIVDRPLLLYSSESKFVLILHWLGYANTNGLTRVTTWK